MKGNYDNLRRHRRDGSRQWILVGLVSGGIITAVVCISGYALGQIRFPALERDATKETLQIVPAAASESPEGTTELAMIEAFPVAEPSQEAQTPRAITPSPAPPLELAQPTQRPAGLVQSDSAIRGLPSEALRLRQELPIPPSLDAIKTRLVFVTGGPFTMGTTLEEATQAMGECARYGKSCTDPSWVQDSMPPHEVTVDSFQIEVYEVNVTQYIEFLNWKGPNSHRDGCEGYACVKTTLEQEGSYIGFDGEKYFVTDEVLWANYPVVFVTWYGAVEYCTALHRRLPSEAEWERAARGSENRLYPWGMAFDAARANSSMTIPQVAVPVDSYTTGPSNGVSEYGVYNLAGNAAEWVSDWYASNYYSEQISSPHVNPQGPPTGVEKVVRGGSWDTVPLFLRTVHRMSWTPHEGTAAIGFRCAADAGTHQ